MRRSWTLAMLICCFTLGAAVAANGDHGTFTINTSMTLDGTYGEVFVIDGASPPTIVDVVTPALIRDDLTIRGMSIVNFRGGMIWDYVRMHDTSTFNISGGRVSDPIILSDASTINITGGTGSEYISGFDTTTINVAGGFFEDGILGFGSSTIHVSDAEEMGSVLATDMSTGEISGGNVWGLRVQGHGRLTLTGGNLFAYPEQPGLMADESGVIRVIGTGFNFPLGPLTASTGTLTGFLADGQPLLTDFLISGNGSIVLGLPLPGDTNADGRVDMEDLNNVRNGFAGTGPDDGTLPGDAFPFDGRVDIDDLNAVRNNFGTSTAAVPEPSAGTLAVYLASMLFLTAAVRWRRAPTASCPLHAALG